MKNTAKSRLELIVALSVCLAACPATSSHAASSSELPSRAEIRKELQGLSPSKREARILGLRREHGSVEPSYGVGRNRSGGMSQQARERMARFQREIQNLPPGEREARISEMRRRFGRGMQGAQTGSSGEIDIGRLSPSQRVEYLKLRRKVEALPMEERQAQMRDFLRRAGLELKDGVSPGAGGMRRPAGELSDEERRRRFQQMRGQAQKRIAALEKKKAEGSITEQEQMMLNRMKQGGQGRRQTGDLNGPSLQRR